MKTKDFLSEINGLNKNEILAKISELSSNLLKVRFGSKAKQNLNTKEILNIKKNVARLRTILNSKF